MQWVRSLAKLRSRRWDKPMGRCFCFDEPVSLHKMLHLSMLPQLIEHKPKSSFRRLMVCRLLLTRQEPLSRKRGVACPVTSRSTGASDPKFCNGVVHLVAHIQHLSPLH